MRRTLFALLFMVIIGLFFLMARYYTTTARQASGCVDIPAAPDYLASNNEQDAIAAINNARAQEHVHPLHLPGNYYQLDPVQQQFMLINFERTDRGLKPLEMDANLAQIARGYSHQLRGLHFFSHTSPIAGTFDERINSNAAITNHYALAAENLAGNPVPGAGAVYEYMYDDSVEACGHRDTILDPRLTLVGIGWVRGGLYGSISAQEFLNPAPWNPYDGALTGMGDIAPQIRIVEEPLSRHDIEQLQSLYRQLLMHRRPRASNHFLVSYQVLAENDVGIVRVTWFLDRVGNAPHTGMVLTLDLDGLSPGVHTLLAYAVNGAQYYGVASFVIVV